MSHTVGLSVTESEQNLSVYQTTGAAQAVAHGVTL